MCKYLKMNDFNEAHDDLPIPLFLDCSNDFYNLAELTNQEKLFLKQIESFNDDNIYNIDPFAVNMTSMNN